MVHWPRALQKILWCHAAAVVLLVDAVPPFPNEIELSNYLRAPEQNGPAATRPRCGPQPLLCSAPSRERGEEGGEEQRPHELPVVKKLIYLRLGTLAACERLQRLPPHSLLGRLDRRRPVVLIGVAQASQRLPAGELVGPLLAAVPSKHVGLTSVLSAGDLPSSRADNKKNNTSAAGSRAPPVAGGRHARAYASSPAAAALIRAALAAWGCAAVLSHQRRPPCCACATCSLPIRDADRSRSLGGTCSTGTSRASARHHHTTPCPRPRARRRPKPLAPGRRTVRPDPTRITDGARGVCGRGALLVRRPAGSRARAFMWRTTSQIDRCARARKNVMGKIQTWIALLSRAIGCVYSILVTSMATPSSLLGVRSPSCTYRLFLITIFVLAAAGYTASSDR
jgi:hypothetical protein